MTTESFVGILNALLLEYSGESVSVTLPEDLGDVRIDRVGCKVAGGN